MGFMIEADVHPVEFLSVKLMLKTILECYEQGVFFLSEDGYLESDDEEQLRIAAGLNPGLAVYSA